MHEKVVFTGAWTKDEMRSVEEAISTVECRLNSAASPVYRKTWFCVREVAGSRESFYFASRVDLLRVLGARTASALAHKISAIELPRANAPAP